MRTSFLLMLSLSFFVLAAGPARAGQPDRQAGMVEIEAAIIEKDFPQAESLCEEFLASKPAASEANQARYYLGLSQLRQKKFDLARATFEKLLREKPDKRLGERAHLGAVDSFILADDYQGALQAANRLNRSRKISEFRSLLYLKLARIHLRLAQWDDARDFLSRIVRDYPDSFEYPMAQQLLEEKQYFAVQVGSFLNRDRALDLATELNHRGEYAYIVETVDPNGERFFRVRVGQLAHLNQARELKESLSEQGYPARIYP